MVITCPESHSPSGWAACKRPSQRWLCQHAHKWTNGNGRQSGQMATGGRVDKRQRTAAIWVRLIAIWVRGVFERTEQLIGCGDSTSAGQRFTPSTCTAMQSSPQHALLHESCRRITAAEGHPWVGPVGVDILVRLGRVDRQWRDGRVVSVAHTSEVADRAVPVCTNGSGRHSTRVGS